MTIAFSHKAKFLREMGRFCYFLQRWKAHDVILSGGALFAKTARSPWKVKGSGAFSPTEILR
jgi:hypothetical protein